MFTVVCGHTHCPNGLSAVLRAYHGNTQDDLELCTFFCGEALGSAACKNFVVEAGSSDQELFFTEECQLLGLLGTLRSSH